MSKLFKVVILFVLSFLAYWPTLKAPFTFDDEAVIVHNPLLWHLNKGLAGVIDVWSFQPSRFFSNLTIAINFLFSQLNTTSYHVVNILIHFLAGLGVMYLFTLLLRINKDKVSKIDFSFIAAIIFILHPLNTESVSFVAQRCSALVGLFYLWAVIFYIKTRTDSEYKNIYKNVFCVFLSSILAILSKETAVTLPLAFVAVDYFILKKRYPNFLYLFGLLFVVIVNFYFNFKWKEILLQPVNSQSHLNDVLTLKTYLLTQFEVLFVLFKLIFIPFGLNLDYDFPMVENFFNLLTVCCATFLLSLLLLISFLRKSHWYFSFAIAIFFITLLAHIIPPRANVISEHKLYLTLALFIPVFIYGLYKHVSLHILRIILIVISVLFFGLTFYRSILWSNPVLLWKDTVNKSPNKPRSHLNLGQSYANQGDYDHALTSYLRAIEINPYVPQAYMSISEIYYRQGKSDDSMRYINKAIDLDPTNYLVYIQKGVLLARQKDYKQAAVFFSRALDLSSSQVEVYKMRGMVYFELKEFDKSISDFIKYQTVFPRDPEVLLKKADAYFLSKKYELSLEEYNQLIVSYPRAQYYYNRSILYEILKDNERMLKDRNQAKSMGFNND